MRVKRIHVVAAIIIDAQQRVLIARRHQHLHQGGLWEFPGGKLEPGETALQALQREIREELALEVVSASLFQQITHDYPDKSVLLEFWQVTEFSGEARGIEGQPIAWVALNELRNFEFPAANVPVVEALLARFI